MFCSGCGVALIENDKYCGQCGKENTVNTEIVQNDSVTPENDSNVKNDISINFLFALFAFYAVLLLIFVGGGFALNIGRALAPMLLSLPIVIIIYLIQKMRELKYQRPILHIALISLIFFILSIAGYLTRGF